MWVLTNFIRILFWLIIHHKSFLCLCERYFFVSAELYRPKFFLGTSRDPKEVLWMIKFSKMCF